MADEEIARALAPFGVQPSAALTGSIREYIRLLLRWNHRVSLTSVIDAAEIVQRHFGESMFGARTAEMERGRMIDVGSGAGFPGLAIKLILPELDVTLIEANGKKSAFLNEVVRALGLSNVKVLTKRIEEMKGLATAVEFVTCRAVRPDKRLLKWATEALVPGGKCVLWLDGDQAADLRKTQGWRWQEPIAIPASERRVIQIGDVLGAGH